MSSKNVGIKLLLKKLTVWLIKERPDHFIFESEAMRELAVNGRGISKTDTSVIPTGVDIHRFKPSDSATTYAHEQFGFPDDAKIVFYSGHMEERKGVRVIVEGAIKIFQQDPASNIKFLICGNKPGEEAPFLALLENTEASKHVVFGGYRNDLPNIMPSCSLGVVASTGWDSFPMSTLEMAASGLPIVVSRLQGLVETLEDGVTGYTFTPGDASDFAEKVKRLLNDEALRKKQSESAVKRIKNAYTKEHQIENLVTCLGACFK
jgi:glycosyltransferase involved in cell wall biosynthesis